MASFPAFALPGGVTPVAALGGVGPTKPDGAETLADPPITRLDARRHKIRKQGKPAINLAFLCSRWPSAAAANPLENAGNSHAGRRERP